MNDKETNEINNQEDENEEREVFISQEYQDFKTTIAQYEKDKQRDGLKISSLQSEIAREVELKLELKNQLDAEITRRKKLENKMNENKPSDKGGFQTRRKSEEELFSEKYLEASQRIRNSRN